MAEGELRDDDEFSQLEAAGDDLLAELGEVYLYVRPIFLIGPCRRRRLSRCEIWPEVLPDMKRRSVLFCRPEMLNGIDN